MAASMFRILHQAAFRHVPRALFTESVKPEPSRQIHLLCKTQPNSILYSLTSQISLLKPNLPIYNLVSGLKVKTVVKRRCKFCVLRWRQGRLYNICSKLRRHNQTQMMKKPYNTWRLTHAFQCPKRPW